MAFDAAQHRRERLMGVKSLGLATPPSQVRSGSKRNLKGNEPVTVSTASSSSGIGTEKVTPDPKHVRINAPTPKALFESSPTAAADDTTNCNDPGEGGVLMQHVH